MNIHPSVRQVCKREGCYGLVYELDYCARHYGEGTMRLLNAIRNLP